MVFLWFCQSLYHIIGRANTYFLMPLLSTVITLKTQKYAVNPGREYGENSVMGGLRCLLGKGLPEEQRYYH